MPKTYVVSSEGALVLHGGRYDLYRRGDQLPDDTDGEQLERLLVLGLAEEGVQQGGVQDPNPPAPFDPATAPRSSEQTAEQPGSAPAKSASKAEWVDFAVSQGASRDDAEGHTKEQLVEQYGGE